MNLIVCYGVGDSCVRRLTPSCLTVLLAFFAFGACGQVKEVVEKQEGIDKLASSEDGDDEESSQSGSQTESGSDSSDVGEKAKEKVKEQVASKGLSDDGKGHLDDFDETKKWLDEQGRPPWDSDDDTAAAISQLNRVDARVDMAGDELDRVPEEDQSHPRYQKARTWLEDYKQKMKKWRKKAKKIDEIRAKKGERRFEYHRGIPGVILFVKKLDNGEFELKDRFRGVAEQLVELVKRRRQLDSDSVKNFVEKCKTEYKGLEPNEGTMPPKKVIAYADKGPDIVETHLKKAVKKVTKLHKKRLKDHARDLGSPPEQDRDDIESAKNGYKDELKTLKDKWRLKEAYGYLDESFPGGKLKKRYQKIGDKYIAVLKRNAAPSDKGISHYPDSAVQREARKAVRDYRDEAKPIRAYVTSDDWNYNRHEISGKILGRSKSVEAVLKIPGEPFCRRVQGTVSQEATGGGNYGPLDGKLYEPRGQNAIVQCK